MNGEKRNTYILLAGMPEGERSLGRPRCMWMDNIKTDLGDIKWGGMDCSGLTQDRDSGRLL
jgi:hypothetical protein